MSTLKDWALKTLSGKAFIQGRVFDDEDYENGEYMKTPPLASIDFANKTASTKSKTYTLEGDPQ